MTCNNFLLTVNISFPRYLSRSLTRSSKCHFSLLHICTTTVDDDDDCERDIERERNVENKIIFMMLSTV
jgi:hypothetical protein